MTIACDRHRRIPVIGESPCPGCEIERLRKEIESLRKDAERYRWLRGNKPDALYIMELWSYGKIQDNASEEIDTAIDKAISEQ